MGKIFVNLPTITPPEVNDADLFAIEDVSIPRTKAITLSNLRTAIMSPVILDNDKWRNSNLFFVRRTSTWNIGANSSAVLVPNVIDINLGTGLNTSTGVFTAPYNGVYSFSGSAYFEAVTQTRGIISMVVTGTRSGEYRLQDLSTTAVRSMQGSLMFFPLLAGETVSFQVWVQSAANVGNNTRTWFSGKLESRT